MFSHHSHSGEFCGHALDKLEECIQQAIKLGMRVFALTEHMPRADDRDLYPEEEIEEVTPAKLTELFASYYATAKILREKYRDQITILIGFEVDYIRPDAALAEITQLRKKYSFDIFVGSVHHVNGIPVDYDDVLYNRAIKSVNETGAWEWGVPTHPVIPSEVEEKYVDKSWTGTQMTKEEEELFIAYFDNQYAMLSSLRPPVVGHFDLIRLKSSDATRPLALSRRVWSLVRRNVEFIASYGGVVELNSAALRKGWKTPYPAKDVAQLMIDCGVKFCMSDDSHGIEDVGYSYDKVLEYLGELGVEEIVCFEWEGLSRELTSGMLVEGNMTNGSNCNGHDNKPVLPEIGKVVKRNVQVAQVKALMVAHHKKRAAAA